MDLQLMDDLFPSLLPELANPLWVDLNGPYDDDAELINEEGKVNRWVVQTACTTYKDPIGKPLEEDVDEEEEEEEEDEEESETNNDDIQMDDAMEEPSMASAEEDNGMGEWGM